MYANIVEVEVDPAADPKRRALYEVVIPRVKQLPGVISGHWFEPVEGKGLSVVTFGTEDDAKQALERMGLKIGSSPGPGVTVQRVDTREVIGNF